MTRNNCCPSSGLPYKKQMKKPPYPPASQRDNEEPKLNHSRDSLGDSLRSNLPWKRADFQDCHLGKRKVSRSTTMKERKKTRPGLTSLLAISALTKNKNTKDSRKRRSFPFPGAEHSLRAAKKAQLGEKATMLAKDATRTGKRLPHL